METGSPRGCLQPGILTTLGSDWLWGQEGPCGRRSLPWAPVPEAPHQTQHCNPRWCDGRTLSPREFTDTWKPVWLPLINKGGMTTQDGQWDQQVIVSRAGGRRVGSRSAASRRSDPRECEHRLQGRICQLFQMLLETFCLSNPGAEPLCPGLRKPPAGSGEVHAAT